MWLSDLMAEEEALRLAETRRDLAREQAAWAALSPQEQAAIIAAREAKFADVPDDEDEETDEDEEVEE